MTIEIHEVEAQEQIERRVRDGGYRDAEELVLEALRNLPDRATNSPASLTSGDTSLVGLFESIRGIEVDWSRSHAEGREIAL